MRGLLVLPLALAAPLVGIAEAAKKLSREAFLRDVREFLLAGQEGAGGSP